jgi:hypothetical protein
VSSVDYLKETIGYLKLYQGLVVAADGGLIGWLLSNTGARNNHSAILAILGLMALTVSSFILESSIT